MANEQPQPARKKMSFEVLMSSFTESAKQWLKDVPEARGLMLVVDWEVGQNDFPPCTIVCRDPSERSSLESMKQAVKLMDHLTSLFSQQITKTTSILSQAEKLVKEKQSPPLTS